MKIYKKIFFFSIVFILICNFLTYNSGKSFEISKVFDYIETFPTDFVENMENVFSQYVTLGENITDYTEKKFEENFQLFDMLEAIWYYLRCVLDMFVITIKMLVTLISLLFDTLWWILKFPAYLIG